MPSRSRALIGSGGAENVAERTIILRADQVAAIRAGAIQVRIPVRVPRGYELQYTASSLYIASGRWFGQVKLNAVSLYAVSTETGRFRELTQPYYPGDVIAVHEPWQEFTHQTIGRCAIYAVDDQHQRSGRWRSGTTMPDWAVRMRLRVKNVLAQRVADITEDDAKACGFGKGKFLENWRKRHGSTEWAWILTVVAITEGGEK